MYPKRHFSVILPGILLSNGFDNNPNLMGLVAVKVGLVLRAGRRMVKLELGVRRGGVRSREREGVFGSN